MPSSPTWRRLLSLAAPERRTLVYATLALVLGSGVQLLAPQGIRVLMDSMAGGDAAVATEKLRETLLALLGLFAAGGVLAFVRAYLFTLAGERVVLSLRQRLFDRLMTQDIGFFDAQRTGDLLSRLTADTTILQNSVTVNVSMALRFGLQALGSFGVLLWTSVQLSMVMLAVVPFVAVGAVLFGRTVRKLSKQTQEALAAASSTAEESLSNIRTVRSFAREKVFVQRYADKLGLAFQKARAMALAYGAFQGGGSFAGYGAIAVVLWYGGMQVLAGKLSVGDLTAFMLYTMFLGFSLGGLAGLWGDFHRAMGASGRVFELLDRVPLVQTHGGKVLQNLRGAVAFSGVSFHYPTRKDVPVLSDVNLTMAPGEVVALVGASGAGKSTIASLLGRFYDPIAGSISLDGLDIREFEPDYLRSQVGMVAQEPVLFATTVADNIRLGRLDASMEQVMAAAKAANAHDFISAFPEGYETVTGERGVRLSGGQKQRVAIARALLKDPKVLVLDEATSALDAESEHLVQEALDRLLMGRTVLVIAHRLSTVRQAHKVLVLEGGRIVEQGTHHELVAKAGVYKRLVERQFSGFE